jgi:glycosidase
MYEVFARFWAPRGLAAVPDEELDRIAALGFEYLWVMGVWTLGTAGPELSRTLFPHLAAGDVVGSPYAIARYEVDPRLGGDAALAEHRRRLARRSIGLVVDFVPNHTALDHDWIRTHPELYVTDASGIVCGKDPYFPAWTDTAQL